MKWYPLAHLAAVSMSSSSQSFKHCSCCFQTPLVRLLGLCLHSCYTSFNFWTQDVCLWCCFQSSYRAGMAKSRWGGTPSYPKTTDLRIWGSIFSSPLPEKKKNRHSIHYSSSCRGKHLIGRIAMVIVKFRPR